MSDVKTWVRKPRGDNFGLWHVWTGSQTLCGRRIPGVKIRTAEAPTINDRYCPACFKHESAGTSGSYRRR